jgi:molybdopterin synthase catalytic subunit
MKILKDVFGQQIRLTNEIINNIKNKHPELSAQIDSIEEALLNPHKVVKSKKDSSVQLYYRYDYYLIIENKYLCVVVKIVENDAFIITAYFTDKIKKGEVIWEKK